ncbi:MAG TPA: hypothetical protein VFW07_14180 [Parafilimonas sp.]|nr:hypothetical protein [Parafilimonas sp.]
MHVFNQVLADKLKEILDLQAKIKLLEAQYDSLSRADEPSEILQILRLKIKYLKKDLTTREGQALTLFN